MEDVVKVSVLVLTYNQENYIAKALDSIIMQKTDFAFEIIVGEDKSTDGTRTVVWEYKKRYPELITVLARKKNMGTSRNLVSALKKCKGKYIAFLEGDDYWIDEYKLQEQYDFLEKHMNYEGVMTDVSVVDRYGRSIMNGPKVLDHELMGPIDYVKTMYPYNQFKFIGSFMMRNCLSGGEYDSYLLKTRIVTDLTMEAIVISKGAIGFIAKKMAAYRWVPSHGNNYSSMEKDVLCRDRIMSFRMVIKLLQIKTHKWVYMRICRDYWLLIHNYLLKGQYKRLIKLLVTEMTIQEKCFYLVYYVTRKITGVS